MTETQTRWEAEPLSRTPLWKPPLGPKSSLLIPFHIHHLSMKRYSPGVQPPALPPSLGATFPKSLDAGGKGLQTPLRLSRDYLAGAVPYQTSAS